MYMHVYTMFNSVDVYTMFNSVDVYTCVYYV
jgi:hypothetical protein